MSSIIQLRLIFPQFLAYVHSLKSVKKFDTFLANMHINLDNAMVEKLIKGFLDIRYAQFADAREKTESKLMTSFSTLTIDDQWDFPNLRAAS